MLKRLLLTMVVFSPLAWSHTFDIGVVSVPGACITSDFPNRGVVPWQSSKQTLLTQDGQQRVLLVVLPSKLDDAQTPREKNSLANCTLAVTKNIPIELLARANSEIEGKISERISTCLRRDGTDISIRFASVRKGEIQCDRGQAR